MAETVSIGVGNPAKIRHPWAVAGLIFATACVGFLVGFYVLVSVSSDVGETAGLAWITVTGFVPIFVLGVYGIFWLYFVLRELRDFGVARSDERLSKIHPGRNVVVVILTGGLVIPLIVILALLMRRVIHAQELARVERSGLPLLVALLVGGFFLWIPLFAFYGVLQDGLNRVWRGHAAKANPSAQPARDAPPSAGPASPAP